MPKVMANKGQSWDLNPGVTLKSKFLPPLEPVRSLGKVAGKVIDMIPPQLEQKVEML